MQDPNSVIDSLMGQATAGDKRALRELCERLKVPIFAEALHCGASWKDAADTVLSILKSFCTDLLAEKFAAGDWRERLATAIRMSSEVESEEWGLSGLSSVPRLAKRTAVRKALKQLTLPELTAVLLKHIDSVGAADMVGVVADTEAEVTSVLLSVHEKLNQAIKETSAGENR